MNGKGNGGGRGVCAVCKVQSAGPCEKQRPETKRLNEGTCVVLLRWASKVLPCRYCTDWLGYLPLPCVRDWRRAGN